MLPKYPAGRQDERLAAPSNFDVAVVTVPASQLRRTTRRQANRRRSLGLAKITPLPKTEDIQDILFLLLEKPDVHFVCLLLVSWLSFQCLAFPMVCGFVQSLRKKSGDVKRQLHFDSFRVVFVS